MAEKILSGLKVAALATDGFEESELLEPKKALEEAGAQVLLVSPKSGEVQGVKHHDKSKTVPVDMKLDDADPAQFDAVLLPGGALNADALRIEPKAQDFVKQADRQKKPVAVICHGPWLLVSAGLVRGRTLTSWPSLQDDIRNAGGNWVDREVVHDGKWVSSRKPADIPAFNREMIKLFAESSGVQRAA